MIDVPIYHDPRYPVRRAYEDDAGLDLPITEVSWCVTDHETGSGHWVVSTGVHVAIPDGYEGQVRMRSSYAKKGFFICNGVGTIDSGYRGEILAYIYEAVGRPFHPIRLDVGDCPMQLVICPVPKVNLVSVASPEELPPGVRGDKGFGSSGR